MQEEVLISRGRRRTYPVVAGRRFERDAWVPADICGRQWYWGWEVLADAIR